MAGPAHASVPGPAEGVLVGREAETAALSAALERAKGGHGETWAVVGQGGMGKTRLLRWLEEVARPLGFDVRNGTCLKESLEPFFPLEQVFRTASPSGSPDDGPASSTGWGGGLPTLGLVEEPRPRRFWSAVETEVASHPTLVVTRERPTSLRAARPRLQKAQEVLWITRVEGTDHVSPGNLDTLAHRAEGHLRSQPGALVAVEGLEYLVSQGEFAPVLRLVQFLRDVAQETDGHLLLTLNPAAFGMREVSLLESDAEVQHVAAGSSEAATPAPVAPAERMLRYLASLESWSRRAPQLVVLDDLQWADPGSASAFQFLARNLASLPVLVVGALREESEPAAAGGRPPIEEVRDALQQAGLLRRLALRGFSVAEASRLAASLLGVPAVEFTPFSEGEALVHRTSGNPYFLREIVLQLQEDGHVRHEGKTTLVTLPDPNRNPGSALPDTVRRLVARRLSTLPPAAREFLEAAAVSGSEFDLAPVAEVLDLDSSRVRARLDVLQRERRLVEPMGERWGCAHPLVWEVTLSEMDPARRRSLARSFAQWWSSHRPQETDTIARLWHEAGDASAARPWLEKAVQEATSRFAAESAAVYLGWMRELRRARRAPPDWEQVRQESDMAREIGTLGRAPLTRDLLSALLQEEPPPPLRVQLLLALGWAYVDLDLRETERIVAEVNALAAHDPSLLTPGLRGRALVSLAHVYGGRGDRERAVEELQKALQVIPPDPPSRVLAEATLEYAFLLSQMDRLPEARKVLDDGYGTALAIRAPVALAMALNARGAIHAREGELGKAYVDFLESMGYLRQRGHIIGYCTALSNAVEMLTYLGDQERAERHAREALDLSRKFGIDRAEATATHAVARVLAFRGKWAEAKELAERCVVLSEKIGRKEAHQAPLLVLAEATAHDPEHAQEGYVELRKWIERGSPEVEENVDAFRCLAELDADAGKFAEAREDLSRARTYLAQKPDNRFLEYLVVGADLHVAEQEGQHAALDGKREELRRLRAEVERGWPPDASTTPDLST